MEIIAACIESGCYSAVFAVLLAFALRSHARRERYYRKVITELVAGLADLERVNVRLDEIRTLCAERGKREKRRELCGYSEQRTSAAEGS